ncbi:MAG: Rieske (2Fe-2S) protein [Mongoliibacter sp.]|uniref:QcrA and Rieske domain-containing protein n=1 Tax=Mongoliibacter sp. TaxID=2022438 RepID=UPI0012EFEEE1|nr:Rieske (2Fe-2S) protein [Mongoliibacter sp.]TVP51686.1 MAG: Rieske (2Fe-2S) protein [Mongoliibacter sp.]
MKTNPTIKSGHLSSERRDFLRKSGSLAIMSMFGIGFFTSCAEDEEPRLDDSTPPANGGSAISFENNIITVDLDRAEALDRTGGWTLVIEARALIVNVGGGNFNALTSVCTHSGCDRNWSFNNDVFICSCHGSRFANDGAVLQGPALTPLRSFPTNVDGRTLTVNVS